MTKPSCCHKEEGAHKHGSKKFDLVLHGSSLVILAALVLYFAAPGIPHIHHFGGAIIEFLSKMWWGVVLGIIAIGLMNKIPREYFTAVLGRGDTFGGLIRAAIAGLFLDLCSHGILMVGAKLYERGASLAQIMTFLIASPWNSISLTIILISLIGWKWTLLYIVASAAVAVVSGTIYLALVKKGKLPANPNKTDLPENFDLMTDAKQRLKGFKPNGKFFADVAKTGWKEGTMILKWLLLGIVIAASVRAFVPADIFSQWFGPTVVGLLLTLVATTIIEVCSEGSGPIASELVTRAAAPGNGFVFLMAGVSTDYTEILVLREFTKSWKIALSLPLVTVPQIIILGWLMNL